MKTSILAAIMATAFITLPQAARANPPGRGGFSGGIPHFSSAAHFARPTSVRPIYGARPGSDIPRSYAPASRSQQTVRYVHPPVQVGSHLPPRSRATSSASPRTATIAATARNAQSNNSRVSIAEASRRYSHARHDRDWWRILLLGFRLLVSGVGLRSELR